MVWVIAATATQLLVATAAVGTTISAYGQIEAGKAQESALKAQAEQERIAAEGRELERQQKLNAALAANVVGMGVSGIKAEGTPSSIALESAKNVGLSEGMMKLSDRLAQAQLRRQGANARSGANMAAAGTLLQGVGGLAAYGGSPTPTTTGTN
tara:strand:- start:749 stop:1210 length:462 start_codon:yes stop_codon:yes gene_type:complete